jgi:alkylation response protein AidB-like acyl-CoA dehydrogenase
MDFELSEDQKLLKETFRKISLNEFAPRAAEIDEREEFPWDNKEILEEQGVFGINCPEAYGGTGAGLLSLALVIEEVARVCASTAHIIAANALVTDTLTRMGTHEQKVKWLKPLAKGSVLGGTAITEPEAGSDVSSIKTTAVKKNGGYIINGNKRFITHGSTGDIFTVVTCTDRAKAHEGITLFVVTSDTPGFVCGKKEKKMGLRGSDTTDLVFEDCMVPEENMIGGLGEGFKILMDLLNHSRPSIAAEAVGIAQGALDAALEYSKDRVQFGQPLSQFQGLQWMITDMALKVELARTLLYRICAIVDNEADSPEIPKLAAMTKWFASDTAMQVTTDAVQIFGGYGYVKEYPVERMMRDAKVTQIYEGTNQICRNIVFRQLLGA